MPDTYWDLFAGYTLFWLIIAAFVVRIRQKQRQIASELAALKR